MEGYDRKYEDPRSELLADHTLACLRYEQDDIASEAVEKLYEIINEDSTKGCPIPRSDLFAVLSEHHSAHPALQRLWEQTQCVPDWVDWGSIERGQRFFHRYAVANMLGFALQGFIGENVAAFGPAEVLVRTGGLSKRNLMKRVLETFQWVVEATESLSSIQPGGGGHASTIRVRLLHASVRRRINRLASERPSYYDTDKLGLPINVYDSILTVTFFCCNPVWVQLPQLGINPGESETEDFIALYQYLSYLLGSPPEYFDSAARARDTMMAMLARKQQPTESSRKIAHAFIDCLADSPPFFLSKDLIYAGCRHFNKPELCEQLGISRPGVFAYLAFKAVCSIVYLVTVAQKLDKRIDDYFISVSTNTSAYYVPLRHEANMRCSCSAESCQR